ncbi:hypothetical protein RRG08_018621 [Elysia crispata]|uniref:Glutathione S-transferase n=1 Tax=Elysia crispata TaxID=231223 RepID=A0AAE1DES8_9GAST|nr:hypothetical protein RRG08_018621 [Elysia crispata]
MAPKLKLVYFNLRGRAECIRLLLHFANVEFEDRRIEFSDWAAERKDAPNQTLPYIEYHGKKYGEALPIARFLARKYRLLGNDELEQFESDILINQVDALRSAAARFTSDSLLTPQQKKHLEKEFIEKKLPEFLQLMEDKLAGKTQQFLVGNSMSFADILVFDVLDRIVSEDPDFPQKLQASHPLLSGLAHNVAWSPNIRPYLNQRPEEISKSI